MKPKPFGPFADPTTGKVNEEGHAFLEAWLEQWHPVALFRSRYKRMYFAAANTLGEDDVDQLCQLGMIHALRQWQPDRSQFSTVCMFKIRGAVSSALVAASKAHNHGVVVGGIVEEIVEATPTDAGSELRELKSEIVNVLRKTEPNERNRAIFYMHTGLVTGQPKTLRETADRFGVSRQRAQQVVKKVKKALEEMKF